MTKTPDIWMLHTTNPREGESQWGGCYIVEADAHNDAATMRKVTGLDWEVVPMVRADFLGECLHQIAEPAAAQRTGDFGRAALEQYLQECKECQIVPDVGGAFAYAWLHAAAPQAVQPAVPVGGQSRFKGEKDWQWCAAEHVAMVLATPSEWQNYEVRYVYAHPAEGIQSHAEAAAAVCINSALKRIHAGKPSEAVAPLEHALSALAHLSEAVPAQCPNINEPRGCWRVACQLGGKCREPERAATQLAAAPQAVQPPVPVLFVSREQLESHTDHLESEAGRYLPARKTAVGKFTMPLYAHPAEAVQAAVSVDVVSDLKNALADAAEMQRQLRLMEEHARGDVWRWQADAANELASMGNRMGVLILASDLRNLLAAAAHPAEGVPALEVNDAMALAFHHALTDGSIGADDLEEIKIGLRAVLANVAATQPAAQGLDARQFPAMTPELASILGLMCFQCASLAQALRAVGHTIKTRAEDEQAAVLHWMLGHYFRHGEDWRTAAAADMARMKAEAQAAQAKQGGA